MLLTRSIPWYGEKLCFVVVHSTSFPALLVGRPAAVRACCGLAFWDCSPPMGFTHHKAQGKQFDEPKHA